MRTPFTGWLSMACATVVAVAFLKYWTPVVLFRMQQEQQNRILDALENAEKPQKKSGDTIHLKYFPPITPAPAIWE